MFKFKIYRNHENQKITEDGELICTPRTDEWFKFDLSIDLDLVRVSAFEDYVLFDTGNNPTPCTKVYLSDGSVVFAVTKMGTLEANYIEYRNTQSTKTE